MSAFDLNDLARYQKTSDALGRARCRLNEFAHATPTTVDRAHREALIAAHEHAAACASLGLDPIMPHPTREREVWAAVEAAGLSYIKRKKQTK